MANYTVELGELERAGYEIGLNSYPIFDEMYRPSLNRKIVNHFYFREIGQETPDRFNFFLERKMSEIMPLYNKMYMSELLAFDPLTTEYMSTGTDKTLTAEQRSQVNARRKTSETQGDVLTANKDVKTKRDFTNQSDTENNGEYDKKGTDEKIYKGTDSKTREGQNTKDNTSDTINHSEETARAHTESTSNTTNHDISDMTNDSETTKSGSKSSAFSDIPQSNIGNMSVLDANGQAVSLANSNYLTTLTNDTTQERISLNGSEHRVTDGTANIVASTDGTTSGSADGTSKLISKLAEVYNETENGKVDNTTNGKWGEDGKDKTTSTVKDVQLEGVTENVKDDTQRNTTRSQTEKDTKTDSTTRTDNIEQTVTEKGRRGYSPSELLMLYRKTFINIDMMIIDELNELFMGVF